MTGQLDLLLVNPGARTQVYGGLGSALSGIEPPLWCALIAAFIREYGYSVKIIDAEAENWGPDRTADKIVEYDSSLTAIVVMGSNPSASSTPKMTAVGKTLRALTRKPTRTTTLLSGLHPSALPERTLREEAVDYVCQGEGFHTILHILETLKSGREPRGEEIVGLCYLQDGETVLNPPAPLVEPDEMPLPAWDLLPMDKYRAHNWHCFTHINEREPYAVIYTSIGCPFNCSYCNIHALYNDKPGIRFRSPEKAVDEIGFLIDNYQIKNLKFIDELFALKEDRVNRICDLIIERGYDLNIWAYARVDTVTQSMLHKMKQAGINWLAYGFESVSSRVRSGVAKRYEQDDFRKAVEMTQAAGIYIIANFIFGLPDDDMETMQETLGIAQELNFEYVNFYTAMAYPGSQLYGNAVKQGIELPEVWHGYGQYTQETLPLPTRYLSASDVLRFRDKAFKEYFSNPEYIEMVREKFGTEVVAHVEDMLKRDIIRKFA